MTGIFDQFGKNFRRFPQDLSMYDDPIHGKNDQAPDATN